MKQPTETDCPCGRGLPYTACCALLHDGAAPHDAEALMRSRYSAYVLGLEPYLLATWHPDTRPKHLDLHAEPRAKWLGLEIRRHGMTGPDSAIVEFVARYRIGGRAHRLHEAGRFVREGDRWLYVDGEFPAKNGKA